MSIADLSVIAATIMAWWSLIPQIRRLLASGDPAGVSGTWPALGLVSNAAWTVYLISQGLWAAVPATSVMVFFYAVVLWTLRRAGVGLGGVAVRGVVASAVALATWAAGSWAGLGLLLGWAYAPQLAPAVWAAYRSNDPRGIAPGTWVMIGIEAGLWVVYGALLADTPVVIFGVVGLVAAALILARVWATTGLRPARTA